MDESTERLLSLAYLAYKRVHKRQEPSVVRMQKMIGEQWAAARLNVISTWADEIKARVDKARLISKVDLVSELVERAGVLWEWPWDDVERVTFVSWGLAMLRWINRAEAGHYSRWPPECAGDEVRDWLEAKKIKQLSLF